MSAPSIIEQAVSVLRAGGVVAAPTDTLVGLLAVATDHAAVERVLAIKGPARSSPISVLFAAEEDLTPLCRLSRAARERGSQGWPGPLTLVVPAAPDVHPALVDRGIGVRAPGPSPVAEILDRLRLPVTGTSANITGEPAPSATEDLSGAVVRAVDLVVPGHCPLGRPSAVIDLCGDVETTLR